VLIDTFKRENFISYAQSAGNLSLLCCLILLFKSYLTRKEYIVYSDSSTNLDEKDKKTDKSSSETTCETSFNFEAFRKISGVNPEKISND
jgi:hypothetical protein